MMERLFAVREQREIFLLMTACGFVWALLQEGADAAGRHAAWAGAAGDVLAAALLLAMALGVMVLTHEGVRLYGLLGVAVGAMLYRCGVSRVAHACGRIVKKACRRSGRGRKSA